jgi:hypothetical protein
VISSMPQRLPLALDDAERSFPPAADGRLYRPAASHNYLLRRASGDLFLGPYQPIQGRF